MSLNLSLVIRAVIAAVASWGGRGRVSGALAVLVYRRLSLACGQMERLLARFQAGKLRPAAQRAVAAGTAAEAASAVPAARPARLWPYRFGWLVEMMGHPAAGYGAQLRTILAEPEMVALLAAAPQAARILRPVCRMLAVETSLLRPPVAGDAAGDDASVVPAPVVRKRLRPKRAPADWGRIPLPKGVLSAARKAERVRSATIRVFVVPVCE